MTIRASIDALLARHGLHARSTRGVSDLDCEIHRIGCDGGGPALRIYADGRTDLASIDAELAWPGSGPLPSGRPTQRKAWPAMRDALCEGYAAHRALPVRPDHQVEVCTAARMLNTVEWVVDVWPRTDLRPWGPGFLRRAARVFDDYLR